MMVGAPSQWLHWGRIPALIAAVSTIGAGYWLLQSPFVWSDGVQPQVALVGAGAALIGWLFGASKRTRQRDRADAAAQPLPIPMSAQRPEAVPITPAVAAQPAQPMDAMVAKAFKQSAAAWVITDAMDRVVRFNEAFIQLTGLEPGAAQGQPAELLGMQPLRTSHLPGIDALWRLRQPWSGEAYLRSAQGATIDVWVSASAVWDAQGCITQHLRVFQDVGYLKRQMRQMADEARHDSLTGLANRRAFDELMFQAMARTRRYTKTLAVMCVDLDGFKCVNDVHGHSVGDQLLVAVSRRLEACVRTTDRVCRMGGDEFMLILEGPGQLGDIRRIGERVLQSIHEPFQMGALEVEISSSIGVAVYDGHEDEASLIKRADDAMYAAKDAGKNQMVFVEPKVANMLMCQPRVASLRA
jgi:diguanylate cyclase (GGDEF)-like protein/PAS domain S-box-containing protein